MGERQPGPGPAPHVARLILCRRSRAAARSQGRCLTAGGFVGSPPRCPVPWTSSLCWASTESRAGDKRPAWDVPPPPPPLLRSPNEIKILTEAISRGKSEELVAVLEPAGSCQAGSPRPSAHHLQGWAAPAGTGSAGQEGSRLPEPCRAAGSMGGAFLCGCAHAC